MPYFHHPDLDRHIQKFYGKYRGTVISNNDPENRGRLLVVIPSVFPLDSKYLPTLRGMVGDSARDAYLKANLPVTWAEPSFPYGGDGVIDFRVPPKNALVWVEFEAGDTTKPIWTGVWLIKGHKPAEATGPDTKVLKTDKHKVVLNDATGTLNYVNAKNGVAYTIDTDGNITATGKSISITVAGDAEISASGDIVATASGKVSMDSSDVQLGTGANEALVIYSALKTYLDTHTHTCAAPGEPSTPPVLPLLSGSTTKVKGV